MDIKILGMKGYIFGALLFLSGITIKVQSTHNRLQTTLTHLNKALSESEKQYAKKLGNSHTAEFYRDDAIYLLQDGKILKMPIDSLYDEKKWSSYRVEIAFDLYDTSVVSAAYFRPPWSCITKEELAAIFLQVLLALS